MPEVENYYDLQIANRVKSKGLQKLRWYCQMCQKQCRDENGFKCHLTSESHKRQMMVFGENPDRGTLLSPLLPTLPSIQILSLALLKLISELANLLEHHPKPWSLHTPLMAAGLDLEIVI